MQRLLIRILVLSCVLALFLAGCGGSPDAIVGTWTSVEHYTGGERAEDLEGMTIEFFDDGTANTFMGSGTYEIEDDIVVFTSDRGDEVRYEISEEQLIVETFVVKIVYEKLD